MNVDIFTTGTDAYHAYRIEPPEVVVDIAKRPPDQLADLRLITDGIPTVGGTVRGEELNPLEYAVQMAAFAELNGNEDSGCFILFNDLKLVILYSSTVVLVALFYLTRIGRPEERVRVVYRTV